jgi:membrane associated rhomboid family serine protease
MFNIPAAVIALGLVFLAIYGLIDRVPVAIRDAVVRDFAFVPGRLTISFWPARAVDLIVRANSDPAALAQARAMRELLVAGGGPKVWTLLTYALLHGSWTHVGLNTVWLFAFGPPVARRFGSARFLLFMAVSAVASAAAHWAASPMDFSPLIGASGSDSGLMGAAARFMFQPGAPLGRPGPRSWDEIESVAAATLAGVFLDGRARIFIGVWLATNFLFGAYAITFGLSEAPVAWVAHLGGFCAGLLLFTLFDRPQRARSDAEERG